MPVNPFKWKHYEGEIILLNVRWYLKYSLSFRNLKEMMAERGVIVDHTTIMRWVHQYSPEIERKIRKHLKPTNDSWRVDETYIKMKGEWKYLYRAVDSDGDTIDFMLSAKRNRKAAKRSLKKALSSNHNQIPRTITIDKNPAYPPAIEKLKNDRMLPRNVDIRQIKYLNNIIEQDHRSIKRIVDPMLGFQSFRSANKTLKGIEALINGTVDIADASREMTENEIKDAQKNGINPIEHTIAYDGITLIVNPSTLVSSLNSAQLRGIYNGSISNWKDAGGQDKPIVV